METLANYFTGPNILSTTASVTVIIIGILSKEPEKTWTFPIIISLAGCLTLSATIWTGINQLGDKKNMLISISPKVRHVISIKDYVLTDLASRSRYLSELNNDGISEELLSKILYKTNPTGASPVQSSNLGLQLNWLQYQFDMIEKTRQKIYYIFQYMPFLDSDLVQILSEIEDCYYFKEITLLANGQIPKNLNLLFTKGYYYEYIQLVRRLDKYYEKNLREYGKNTPAFAIQPVIK